MKKNTGLFARKLIFGGENGRVSLFNRNGNLGKEDQRERTFYVESIHPTGKGYNRPMLKEEGERGTIPEIITEERKKSWGEKRGGEALQKPTLKKGCYQRGTLNSCTILNGITQSGKKEFYPKIGRIRGPFPGSPEGWLEVGDGEKGTVYEE